MNRLNIAIHAAFLASSMAAGVAVAQSAAGGSTSAGAATQTQNMPQSPAAGQKDKAMKGEGAAQSKKGMMAGDKPGMDKPAMDSSGSGSSRAGASKSGSDTAAAGAGGTRDWAKVDTNHDNLISGEEMEQWLAANKGSSGTASGSGTGSSGTAAGASGTSTSPDAASSRTDTTKKPAHPAGTSTPAGSSTESPTGSTGTAPAAGGTTR